MLPWRLSSRGLLHIAPHALILSTAALASVSLRKPPSSPRLYGAAAAAGRAAAACGVAAAGGAAAAG
ncbi:hypothetical protein FGB62_81g015 [Gracilaria domingensis]|nr:hypothetical protein FGB62_81g015 [Gracilaria domingensis]